MEKKRKILEVESDDSQATKIKKKKKKDVENKHKDLNENEDMIDSEQIAEEIVSKEDQNIERKKKEKPEIEPGKEICLNGTKGVNIIEKKSESIGPSGIDKEGIITPTTKKPPRKSGETKKQYKRRIRALREAGVLIDPPVVEGAKKDKRNKNKSRKEKRMAKEQKNEELDKFRSIVQINYLKMWKSDPSKWKFNKNVQGKIIKHMFDASRIPQDIFEVLIEYVTGPKTSTKMHNDINKKCSQVVEAMEKWTSANEEEKKKLTEPDQQVYERARKMLQSLA